MGSQARPRPTRAGRRSTLPAGRSPRCRRKAWPWPHRRQRQGWAEKLDARMQPRCLRCPGRAHEGGEARAKSPRPGGGGSSAARPGGGEQLSPGLGGSRCCLRPAVAKRHRCWEERGRGRPFPHMALTPAQAHPVEGRSCRSGLWHHWACFSAQDGAQEWDRAGSPQPWLSASWAAPPELLLRARVPAPVGRAHTPPGLLPAAALGMEATGSRDARPTGERPRHCCGRGRPGTRAGQGATEADPAPGPSGGDHGPRALTSCCEEQRGVEIVGRQPLPLQGTENNTEPPSCAGPPRLPGPRCPPELRAETETAAGDAGRGAGERPVAGADVSKGSAPRQAASTPLPARKDAPGTPNSGRSVAKRTATCPLSPASSSSAAPGGRWGNEGHRGLAP